MKRFPVTAKVCLLTFVLAVLVSGTAFGQGITGTITGIVKDPNGGRVPEAKVVVQNRATGAETSTTTDADGYYRLSSLTPGEYSVTVEAKGFKKVAITSQRLSTGDSLRLDVALELGSIAETVSVQTSAVDANTEGGQLGKVLFNPSGLPVLSGNGGRNVLSLAGIQPGVVYAGQLSGQQAGVFSANGQRAQANNYFFDGGDSNDLAINVPDAVQGVSPNAVQEFRLITGAFKAEYGRNSGAIVQVVPRTGGNAWHGGASEIFRNTILNAVPFFLNSVPGGTPTKLASGLPRKPQWNSNDFDANFGGPIKKGKTFFFISYLGFRRRQGVSASATVFNDAQRAAIQAVGTPESKALLALVPPASTGSTLFSAPANSLNRDQGLARFDHQFTEKNQFSATYFIEDQAFTDPFAFGGGTVPGFGTIGTLRFQNVILRDAHVFSPTLVNEVRVSFHRRGTLSVIPLNKTTLSSLGLSAIVPDDPAAQGPPNIRISGFTQFGNTIQGPQGRNDDTFQYIDNLSWTFGHHYLKFGGEFRTYGQNQIFDFENNGIAIIDGSGTALGIVPRRISAAIDPSGAVNDFASNFATVFLQTSAGRRGYRTRSVNLFAQDDWKVASNFTLNLGLRWEYNTGLKDVQDRVFTFRAGQQSTVFPDAPVGMVFPGDTGITRSTYKENLKNFAPRFGFAWDPRKNGKLIVRGGYGLFYDAPISELTLQFLLATPFAINPSTIFTDYNNPWLGSRVNPIPQPFPFTPVQRGGHFDFTKVAPIGMTIMDPNFATPYGQQWDLQVQYQLKKDWSLEVGYVGGNGVHLLNRREINPANPTPSAAFPNPSSGNTNQRRILNIGNPQDARFGGAVFGGITDQLTDANSSYNSLQIFVTKRFSHGFTMTHAYTWGHAIDNASGLRVSSQIFGNPRADRGNSEQDIRHRYVASYRWEAPWMKAQAGALGHLLGGWGMSGVTTFQSGPPFSITEPNDRCLCASGNQRPDFVGGTIQLFDPRSTTAVTGRPNSLFNGTGGGTATAGTNPFFLRVGSGSSFLLGAGRFGNLGRNTMVGPGLNNWDFAVFKRFKVSETHQLEFRSEFFNVFNHTQFAILPGDQTGNIGSSNFGVITSTQDPRIIQFALRYTF